MHGRVCRRPPAPDSRGPDQGHGLICMHSRTRCWIWKCVPKRIDGCLSVRRVLVAEFVGGFRSFRNERFPNYKSLSCRGELLPGRPKGLLWASLAQVAQDPGGLREAGCEHARARTSRPGPIALPSRARPRSVEMTGTGTNRGDSKPRATGRPRFISSATEEQRSSMLV
jgi:hypothetical protein